MWKPNKNWDELIELDQILVPVSGGTYQAFEMVNLLGFNKSILASVSGFGTGPLHFITQRGPFQDGSTPLDMRWDDRVIQIVIDETFANRTRFFDKRYNLLQALRPNRSFGLTTGVQPLIYRKHLPGGKVERGTDIVTIAGSATITSARGKFIHNGLRAGMGFEITSGVDVGTYQVLSTPNDYTIILNANMAGSATNVHWRYIRGNSYRDLFCLMEQGPQFNENADSPWRLPAGYREAIRFVANDPFWYGEEQTASWTFSSDIGDLIFDYPIEVLNNSGAWLGESAGSGRWLFAEDFLGDTSNLIYWGHEAAYPVIEIDGTASNVVVQNSTIGVEIILEYSIAVGETVTIDTKDQSVTNNFGDNLFPYITGDLATLALYPEPQAPNRENSFSISYDNASSTSEARIKWRNKYVTL